MMAPALASMFYQMAERPSAAWQSFGGHVREDLAARKPEIKQLISGLLSADPGAVGGLVDQWRTQESRRTGGFGEGVGPGEIPQIPGATGTDHEWGADWDPNPVTVGLRALVAAAQSGLPPDQRFAAFANAYQEATAPHRQAVTDAYREFLGRDPSDEELAGWVGASLTPARYAMAISRLPAASEYRDALARNPQVSGDALGALRVKSSVPAWWDQAIDVRAPLDYGDERAGLGPGLFERMAAAGEATTTATPYTAPAAMAAASAGTSVSSTGGELADDVITNDADAQQAHIATINPITQQAVGLASRYGVDTSDLNFADPGARDEVLRRLETRATELGATAAPQAAPTGRPGITDGIPEYRAAEMPAAWRIGLQLAETPANPPPELRAAQVGASEQAYRALEPVLGRAPTAGEVRYWGDQLMSGTLTPQTLAAALDQERATSLLRGLSAGVTGEHPTWSLGTSGAAGAAGLAG